MDIMKRRKVSKLEEKNSLMDTLARNEIALDYIQNEIYRVDNIFKLDETDKEIKENLESLRYIQFSLNYLDDCYRNRLKALGVRV